MNAPVLTENKLTIRRTINAPIQKVFDAWTQPEHLLKWWHCDPAWTTEVAEVDLRVGGKYRLGMQNPELDFPHVCFGHFIEVDAPNRLVYTWEWEEPSEHPGESQVTVEFSDVDGSTEILIVHEGFSGTPATEAHSKGWQGALAVFDSIWT